MLGADCARPLARLPPHGRYPLPPLANTNQRQKFVPYLRCADGDCVAGVPDCRGTDRLAPPEEPRRLDLLWRGLTLPSTALRPGLLQLRRFRKICLAVG